MVPVFSIRLLVFFEENEMRTLAWLKNHCIELDRLGVGYMHPHISAVELLVIIGEIERHQYKEPQENDKKEGGD